LAHGLHGGNIVLKVKDIIALGALAAVSFPVVLLGVLLWTGNVRMVFGPEAQDPSVRARLLERAEDVPGATKSSSDSSRGILTDSSLYLRQADLDRREAEALRETQRVLMIQQDDSRLRDTITAERKRLEVLLGKGDTLDGSRTAVLAATFSNMKADQASKILLALDDILAVAILRNIPDDKPRAKILAAMGKLDVRRAAQISRLLAALPGTGKRRASAETAQPDQPSETTTDTAKAPTASTTPTDSPAPSPKTETKK
jgi:flagellar motility protein MotE (MotC chaperone)